MTGSRDPLAPVKRAASTRRRAEQQYRAALVAAVLELEATGARDAFARVSSAAGVSRQAVRELVERHRASI